jgi:hypothetical protein
MARIPVAMTVTGFVVGLPLYYNVGFVLMIPLIFSLVYQSGRPAVALGMPLLAGLSIAHGFLPPHPSATALVVAVHADMGKTLLYGLVVAIPTLIIAGPIFAMSLKHIRAEPAPMFRDAQAAIPDSELPGTFNSFVTALLPVVVLGALTLVTLVRPDLSKPLAFLSSPLVVMLLSYFVAVVTLGIGRGQPFKRVTDSAAGALREISPILMIIAGAGGLKQVLIDSGVSAELGTQLAHMPVHPLLLGWAEADADRRRRAARGKLRRRPEPDGARRRRGEPDVQSRERFRLLDVQGILRPVAEGYVPLVDDDGDHRRRVRTAVRDVVVAVRHPRITINEDYAFNASSGAGARVRACRASLRRFRIRFPDHARGPARRHRARQG